MKMRNLIFSIFMFIGLFFGMNILNVSAKEAPGTINTKSKSGLYYFSEKYGTDYIKGYNFYRKELTDGTLAYCISNINTSVPAGMTLTSKGALEDPGLEYIIKNGFPFKTFTGNDKKDYYITQSAIWRYFDETRGSSNWKSNVFTASSTGMSKYVYDLVQKAKQITKFDDVKPTISLIHLSDEMKLNDEFYESDPIKVELTNTTDDYEVKLENAPSGTVIKNKDGEEKTTFNSNEEFRILVPKKARTGKVDITISAKGIAYRIYAYTSGRSGYQEISPTSVYEKFTELVNQKLSLFFKEKIITKVKISKQDITNQRELPGATLTIKDSNGKEIETWVSTNEPHYIEGLKPGDYTLIEKIAPEGYVLSTESIRFNIKDDGTTTNVTMYNSKEKVIVKISKQDITNNQELPGATLVIKDNNGNVIDEWVSTNEPHYIEGIDEGVYTLTETIAPEGYVLSTESIEFTVKADGKVTEVIMHNKPYVEVPITDLDVNQSIMIIASIVMILGLGLVVYHAKFSK